MSLCLIRDMRKCHVLNDIQKVSQNKIKKSWLKKKLIWHFLCWSIDKGPSDNMEILWPPTVDCFEYNEESISCFHFFQHTVKHDDHQTFLNQSLYHYCFGDQSSELWRCYNSTNSIWEKQNKEEEDRVFNWNINPLLLLFLLIWWSNKVWPTAVGPWQKFYTNAVSKSLLDNCMVRK